MNAEGKEICFLYAICLAADTRAFHEITMNQKEPDMRWLVDNRCAIQNTALELHLLLEKAEHFKDMQSSLTKQDLVGVLFCLWRGVFLAHGKKGEFQAAPKAAKQFLKKVIEDNSIAFGDDKNWKEWTANFYIDCAGHILAGFTPTQKCKATPRLEDLDPPWQLHMYPAEITERWEYNHDNLKAKMRSLEQKQSNPRNCEA
jgi:hypothetical protein